MGVAHKLPTGTEISLQNFPDLSATKDKDSCQPLPTRRFFLPQRKAIVVNKHKPEPRASNCTRHLLSQLSRNLGMQSREPFIFPREPATETGVITQGRLRPRDPSRSPRTIIPTPQIRQRKNPAYLGCSMPMSLPADLLS